LCAGDKHGSGTDYPFIAGVVNTQALMHFLGIGPSHKSTLKCEGIYMFIFLCSFLVCTSYFHLFLWL